MADLVVNVTALKDRYGELLRHVERGDGDIHIQRRDRTIARLTRPHQEAPMPDSDLDQLDPLQAQSAGPNALYTALLKVHNGDRAAAARALLAHIQTEQVALALLLANGGN